MKKVALPSEKVALPLEKKVSLPSEKVARCHEKCALIKSAFGPSYEAKGDVAPSVRSSEKRKRWQSFSTIFSACFSCGLFLL